MVDIEPMPPCDTEEEDEGNYINTYCVKCGEIWNGSHIRHIDSDGGDYIRVTCKRCGYHWDELPLDASDEMRPDPQPEPLPCDEYITSS